LDLILIDIRLPTRSMPEHLILTPYEISTNDNRRELGQVSQLFKLTSSGSYPTLLVSMKSTQPTQPEHLSQTTLKELYPMIARSRRVRSLFDSYLIEIDETPLLTAQEERELATRVRAGDMAARDQLVRANLRLVVSVARTYAGKGLAVEDLVGEGNMGLIRAAEGYDPNAGTRFATYATYWIRQSIRRALSRDANTLRLPSYMWTLLAKWHRASTALRRELGRGATDEEIATHLRLSKRQTRAVQKAFMVLTSGQSLGTSEHDSLIEQIASNRCGCPLEELDEAEEVQGAMVGLANLDEREAAIIRLRFGLDGEAPITLKEVGAKMGYTKERIRQIEREALAKLRGRIAA
jgi:RNA polymerase primary sigma factor